MPLRFRRSVKIAPGIRLNVSKRGVGVSAGVKGTRVTLHSTGRSTRTIGLPGTGLHWRQDRIFNSGKARDAGAVGEGQPRSPHAERVLASTNDPYAAVAVDMVSEPDTRGTGAVAFALILISLFSFVLGSAALGGLLLIAGLASLVAWGFRSSRAWRDYERSVRNLAAKLHGDHNAEVRRDKKAAAALREKISSLEDLGQLRIADEVPVVMRSGEYPVFACEGTLAKQTRNGTQLVEDGQVIVTNHRLVYIGAEKSMKSDFKKLISVDADDSGLVSIARSGKQSRDLVFVAQPYRVTALCQAIAHLHGK